MNYRFGPFEINPSERRLMRDGRELHLQPKTFDTLALLVDRRGHLVTKDALLAHLWPDMVVTENSLTRCIREVRKALGDSAARSRYVETVPKAGYRFIADVTPVDDAANAIGTATTPRVRWRWLLAAIAIAAIALALWQWLERKPNGGEPDLPILAIAPFGNQTADPENNHVMKGLSEDIRKRLASSGRVAITSGVSAAAVDTVDPEYSSWPRALNADWLLTGYLAQGAKHQFVSLKLSSAPSGPLWQEEIRVVSGDFIGVAEKISRRVADSLGLTLPAQPRYLTTAASVESINAHHQYLMARGLIAQRHAEDLANAIQLLHQVLEVVPDHADAMAALGIAYILSPDQYYPEGVARERADSLFEQALGINPDSALAWAGKALSQMTQDAELDIQRHSIERALELNPYDADVLGWAAELAGSEGRIDDAFDYYTRALAIDPLHTSVSGNLSFNLLRQGRYQQAKALLEDATTRLGAHPSLFYFKVGVATTHGDLRYALEQAQQAVLDFPQGMFFAGQLARAYAQLQMREEAQNWLDYARALPGKDEQRFGAALNVHKAFGDRAPIKDLMGELLVHPAFEDAVPKDSAPWVLGILISGHGLLEDCNGVTRYFNYRFDTPQSIEGRRGSYANIASLAHWMTWCQLREDRGDEAQPWLRQVTEHLDFMKQHGLGESIYDMQVEALNLLFLGRKDESLTILERMVEIGWLEQGDLQHDPRWDGLRGNPRFTRQQEIVTAHTSEIRKALVDDSVVEIFNREFEEAKLESMD